MNKYDRREESLNIKLTVVKSAVDEIVNSEDPIGAALGVISASNDIIKSSLEALAEKGHEELAGKVLSDILNSIIKVAIDSNINVQLEKIDEIKRR